jgi:hypothetical protein
VIYFFLWHQRTPDYLFQGDMLFGRMAGRSQDEQNERGNE